MRRPDKDQATTQASYPALNDGRDGGYFGVHYLTVSRAVRKFEEDRKKM
ncbi:hypothetical protein [Candidatus Nitrotoga sp. 1052]|nr:hypothetical protein [Candidatus Nitrotoga sp. 1052]CAH1074561.1 hypothetical protein NTG1052_220014 [Candidatus Nitrotoga sp. 1052]